MFTVSGYEAVAAIAKYTPELIERLFFDEARAAKFSETCRFLAQARKIYRLVPEAELRKISESTHHQGAAVVIEPPSPQPLTKLTPSSDTLCLNDIANPHNVGAILRTAAFFGLRDLIVSQTTYDAAMTPSAWRVAEGGLTHVKLHVYPTPADFFSWAAATGARTLAALKPGIKTQRTLSEFKADKNKSVMIVCLGNEESGLPEDFVGRCAGRFTIPGSGKIDSLNVSVTAALCLSALSS